MKGAQVGEAEMLKKEMALCQRPIWLVFLILSSSHYLLTEQNPAILSDTHCNCNCIHCIAFHTLARPLWLKLSGKNIQWNQPLLPQSWDCGQKLSFVGVGVHSIQNMAVWTIKMQKDPQRPETTASFIRILSWIESSLTWFDIGKPSTTSWYF